MFYSQFILAKKGPLGTIWIAAHLERKLRKNQVADTDIGVSVDSILFPEMPIALRLSSHLLLGVVRIYSKKVNYLFDDCSEALLKVKQAFRATAVDLPPEETTAPYHSITLPETFDLDDFELPDNELQGNFVDQHISSKDQITLQDTMDGIVYSTSKFGLDERFGDGEASGLDLEEELVEKAATPEPAPGASTLDNDPQASDHDDYSGDGNQDFSDYDEDNEPVDYAQAPRTPGLWEEPNLSNIQDTSACDDHQELEHPARTESAVKENLENVFQHEHHNQFQAHEKSVKSPPHVAGTKQTLIHDLGLTPSTGPVSTEPVIPVSNDSARMDDLLNKDSRDQILGFQTVNYNRENSVQYQGNQENTFHLATELESNTGKDNFVHTPQHHASTPVLFPHDSMPNPNIPSLRPCITFQDQETNAEAPHVTETLNTNFPEIHHAEIHQNHQFGLDNATQRVAQIESINYTNDYSAPVTQRVAQVDSISNYTKDYSAPATQRVAQVESISNYTKDYSAPVTQKLAQVESISNYTKDYSAPVTQRVAQVESINNYTNDYSAAASVTQRVAQVESIINYTKDYSAPVTQRVAQVGSINNYTNDYSASAPVNQRVAQVESINNYANDYSTPVIQSVVQAENVNSYANDFPAPEKRLSLPHWLSDVPKTFVPESTPVEKDVKRGQKRNFTESSMSTHSLNLNESSGVLNTHVTSQSSDLNAHSSFYTTNTSAQSLNLNQSSGFHTTNTSAQNLNFNQSPGFFTTNTSGQNLNFNQSSGFYTTNTTAESLKSNQSSGIVTTNTTPHGLNLNQSAGSFSMDMTGRSAATDGDVLSSILVGRRSILKTNPGPPVMTPSTKRRRAAAPKTGVPKRKVLMDDTMVLHGDTIRLQLTNTEDIRRLRKKAPCTRSEISMLEKQFWEDKIFSEPIFTGVSIKLASLHKQLYNLSKIVVSHNDASLEHKEESKSTSQNDKKETRVEVESTAPKENATVDPVAQPIELPNVDPVAQPVELPNVDPVAQPIDPNVYPVSQPIELPKVTDSRTRDNNTVNLDYYGSQPPQMAATEHVAEPLNSEHDLLGERTAMEIDPKSFPDADVGVPVMPTEVEPPTHADVIPSDTFDMPAAMSEVQVDAPLLISDPGVNLTEKTGLHSFDMDINSIKSLESNIAPETDIDVAPPVKEVSEEKHDQDMENRKNEEEIVNEDAALASNVIVNEDATLGSNVNQDAALPSNVIVNEDAAISSNVTVNEDAAVSSNVIVNQDATLASNVNVNEDAALTSNVNVNEDAALPSNVNVNENVALASDVTVNEDAVVASNVTVNEDAVVASNVESSIQNSVYHGIFGEEFGTVAAYDTEVNPASEIVAQDERENLDHHVTLDTTEMNVEDKVDDDEVARPTVENNTDFLNLDDADDAAAGGDNELDAEAAQVIDNSGWSSRTKAVAKYLQIMFDKEGERDKRTVAVNNLLVGKTRKEASRMFFETLVLKTKDYIHVEQTVPFENINIFPRAKLLKSEF